MPKRPKADERSEKASSLAVRKQKKQRKENESAKKGRQRASAAAHTTARMQQDVRRHKEQRARRQGAQQASHQHFNSQAGSAAKARDQHASQPAQESRRDPWPQPAGPSLDPTPPPSQAESVCVEQAQQGSGYPAVQRRRTRVALVFGREELGLSDDEVDACSVACSIPIGRLQESLSLSHAVSIVLSSLYAQRLASVTGTGRFATAAAAASSRSSVAAVDPLAARPGSGYVVTSVQELAAGYDASEGTEL